MKKTIEKTIQSVDRALHILEQFSVSEKEIGLTDLSNRLDLKRTTCYGLAETLLAHGYLSFNEETSRYRLGLKVFQLGQVYSESVELRDLAKPFIQQLSDRFCQTVHLVVPDGMDAVYIDKVGETAEFRIRSRVGTRAERYCSAISKIVLSHLNENAVSEALSQPIRRYTARTLTEPNAYRCELAAVREKGYAVDDEELEQGLVCVAGPVYNHRRELVGAISMSGNAEFMHRNLGEIVMNVMETASSISNQIGG